MALLFLLQAGKALTTKEVKDAAKYAQKINIGDSAQTRGRIE
jgi:hypothetical protein